MSRRFLALAAIIIAVVAGGPTAQADEYVSGYTRSDGTYVAPHYRSSPNNSYNDNWSVQGNTNPYTGASGTKSPTFNDRTPSYNSQTFGYPGYSSGSGYGWR